MAAMTKKERVEAALAHGKLDRTPFCLVDGGAWIAKTENLSYRQLYSMPDGGAEKIVKWHKELDTDIISAVSGVFTACLNAFGCPIHIDEPGKPIVYRTTPVFLRSFGLSSIMELPPLPEHAAADGSEVNDEDNSDI